MSKLTTKKADLKDQIYTLPAGKIIVVDDEQIQLVRYHARGCRAIRTWANDKPGMRDVMLGKFIAGN